MHVAVGLRRVAPPVSAAGVGVPGVASGVPCCWPLTTGAWGSGCLAGRDVCEVPSRRKGHCRAERNPPLRGAGPTFTRYAICGGGLVLTGQHQEWVRPRGHGVPAGPQRLGSWSRSHFSHYEINVRCSFQPVKHREK